MAASPEFPTVLGSRGADGLQLQVGNRVGAAAGKQDQLILAAAGAGAARSSGRWARMLAEIRVYADVPTATADLTYPARLKGKTFTPSTSRRCSLAAALTAVASL